MEKKKHNICMLKIHQQDLFKKVFIGNIFDNIIVKYLKITDLNTLRFTYSFIFRKMKDECLLKHIKTRMIGRLKKIFNCDEYTKYDSFVDIMIKTKAIISGSFVLQCILDETWENSDVDIYVSDDCKKSKMLYDFLESISQYHYSSEYKTFGYHIGHIENFHSNNYKLQLIFVRTSKKYTLKDHNNNTGFDICKNMLYFDRKRFMNLDLCNLNDILLRRTTFSILAIDDFFYRIEKYSKRNFYFKPKYNKLLFLEYILLKFSHEHFLKTLTINHKHMNTVPCGINCPIKLLFRNVRHIHESITKFDENENLYLIKCIYVDNTNGMFNKILPQLIKEEDVVEDRKTEDRQTLKYFIQECSNIEDYMKNRNTFTTRSSAIDVNDTSLCRYDIKFGLNQSDKKEMLSQLTVKKKRNYPTDPKPVFLSYKDALLYGSRR